jgi:cellulose synthase/poly-beta-1,6-N-acetylglucosamine synthase-like glycosyltransferase
VSAAVSLMQALLQRPPGGPDLRHTLDEALLTEVDPLHWCATHMGVSDAEVMRRAAAWANLPFLEQVPPGGAQIEPVRLEMLAEIRLHRGRTPGGEVAYAAPDFPGVLRLAEASLARPELRDRVCLVPATALREFLASQSSNALLDNARQSMVRRWPHAAAQLELTGPVRLGFVAVLVVLTVLIMLAPLAGQNWLAPLWVALVLLPTGVRLLALLTPPASDAPPAPTGLPWSELPLYSVLVPLRDEANMVEQLCAAMARINYPAEKLDIIFVVEGRSPATVAAVRRHLSDARFSVLVVPDMLPRTKPKALDYALPLCRGEFLVVFDAEDRPEPDQLLRVVGQFRREPDLACIQARLVIDNGGDGLLPTLFAGEYAGLFAVLLPALARWGLVMPLGGTSNHFRTSTLRELGGWDAFNVTEDADLGVRLARRGLRCATTTAQTLEAAPTHLTPWIGQRTRWMKGWMQTYVVHSRRPGRLVDELGWRGTVMFQIILLGMMLSPVLHISFFLLLPVLAATGQFAWAQSSPWPIACMLVLVVGHAVAITSHIVGLARTGQGALVWWQALLPLYWLLIGAATILALREFALRPFHWFKTPHLASASPAKPARRR